MVEVKIQNGRKRGVLFTVSILLLAIVLVSMAIVLSSQSAKSKRTVVGIMDVDRVSGQHSNVEAQLAKIMSPSINISVKQNEAVFTELLPLPQEFAADIVRFEQFEAAYSDLNMTMDLTGIGNGSFVVMPNAVNVTNPQGAFYMTPSDNAQSAGAVQYYDVNITYPVASANCAWWMSKFLVANGSANAVWVHVRVQDASFAFLQDSYYTLDKYSTSYLNITQGGAPGSQECDGGSQVGFVQLSSPAALQVNYSGNIGLKASIGLSNPVSVEANDTVSIIASANRTGRVGIA